MSRRVAGLVAAAILAIGLFGLFTSPATVFGFSCPSIVDSMFDDSVSSGVSSGDGVCASAAAARGKWAWLLTIVGGLPLIGLALGGGARRAEGNVTTRDYRGIEVTDVTGSDWLDDNTPVDDEVLPRHEERKKRNLGIRRPPRPPDPEQ